MNKFRKFWLKKNAFKYQKKYSTKKVQLFLVRRSVPFWRRIWALEEYELWTEPGVEIIEIPFLYQTNVSEEDVQEVLSSVAKDFTCAIAEA